MPNGPGVFVDIIYSTAVLAATARMSGSSTIAELQAATATLRPVAAGVDGMVAGQRNTEVCTFCGGGVKSAGAPRRENACRFDAPPPHHPPHTPLPSLPLSL